MSNRTENLAEIHTRELPSRISWIIRLRWVAAAGVGATVVAVPRVFGIGLEENRLYIVTLCLAAYNTGLWCTGRWVPQVASGLGLLVFANVQIGIDLVFLTTLLHFAGGVENPFVCYYVFHIVIASILLSKRATCLQVVLALLLFAGTVAAEFSGLLPHYHLSGYFGAEVYRNTNYLAGVVFVIGTMLCFTAFMATSIVAQLRERDAEIVMLSVSLGERATELQRAYDVLQRLEREKSEYMRRAAHDLRSPMSAVDLLLAVVAEGRAGEISEKGREMLRRARGKIEQILELAEDLLALSRAREAAFSVDARSVDLSELVGKLEDDLRQRAASASIAVAVETSRNPVAVMGDPGAIGELLENLLSNALKYTPAGGSVRVSLSRGEGEAVIEVADTGIGIAQDDIESVFDEFYRADNARESGQAGTGLGLSIAKTIAESHRGTIGVESEPGHGTTFRVVMPLAGAGVVSQVGT
ncbi:MAG: HAMP domain-containing histidine kinase [Armatimonadetes bacterium]|nr:HAMP domain-containing histidine kinase [Armatimonadota bacterium]